MAAGKKTKKEILSWNIVYVFIVIIFFAMLTYRNLEMKQQKNDLINSLNECISDNGTIGLINSENQPVLLCYIKIEENYFEMT